MGVGATGFAGRLDGGKGTRMTNDQQIMRASGVAVVGRRPRTVDERRICPIEGCNTKLSRYNLGEACLVHQPVRFPRIRGGPPPEEL
jgi:hypothetical protein